MNYPRPIHISAIVAILALAAGCQGRTSQQWRPQRLGTAERFEVAREVRSTLPDAWTNTIKIPDLGGCRVYSALANLDRSATLSYTVTGISEDGSERLLLDSAEPATYGWKDVSFDIGRSSPVSLRFETGERGRWAQPIAYCERRVEQRHPNVILVSLDTLRADQLTAYGSTKHVTPHLDELARTGTIFEQVYAQFPNTYGSHASMFTGMYPRQHGLISGRDARIIPGSATLAAAFAGAGYRTVAFTENAFVGSAYGFDVGFDTFHNGPLGSIFEMFPGEATVTFGRAIAWLKARPPGPFFMFLHTYEVHSPYEPTIRGLEAFGLKIRLNPNYMGRFHAAFTPQDEFAHNAGVKPLGEMDLRQVETLYDIETLQLDRHVKALMDELAELDLLDDTLLVFTSDHGEEFGEHGVIGHGENLHQGAMHVPLILLMPGRVPAGKRISQPIGLLDLGPTIATLAGIGPVMPGTPASDRSPLVLGTELPVDDFVVSELNQNITSCPWGIRREPTLGFSDKPCPYDAVAVRDQRYTYIERKTLGTAVLFDRREDPDELVDIAARDSELTARYIRAAADYRSGHLEGTLETAPTEVDPMTRDKLRALGYIQ